MAHLYYGLGVFHEVMNIILTRVEDLIGQVFLLPKWFTYMVHLHSELGICFAKDLSTFPQDSPQASNSPKTQDGS